MATISTQILSRLLIEEVATRHGINCEFSETANRVCFSFYTYSTDTHFEFTLGFFTEKDIPKNLLKFFRKFDKFEWAKDKAIGNGEIDLWLDEGESILNTIYDLYEGIKSEMKLEGLL